MRKMKGGSNVSWFWAIYGLLSSQWLLPSAYASQTLDDEIEEMLSSMSLKQKINQMAQIDVATLNNGPIDENIDWFFGQEGYGSILVDGIVVEPLDFVNLMEKIQNVTKTYNLPPVIAGLDSVHGANAIRGAVIFPQQINLASTFNPSYAKYAGKIAARDTMGAGINWLFSPIVGLGIQPLWPRMFETFGEDPLLVGKLATKMVEGIQENPRSAACAKHFVGYSDPRDGRDRSPSWIPVRHLYQYFVRPWRDVINNAKPLTIMESYSEYDGVPNVANRNSLQTLLRKDLGFDGVLVTDYHEIQNLFYFHKVAADNNEAVELALLDGSVDISMIPLDYWTWGPGIMASINETKSKGNEVENRIDRSVRRILKMKKKLNMFDDQMFEEIRNDTEKIGDTEVRKAAEIIARDSIVLAKNMNKVLPIVSRDDGEKVKVYITGPTMDSLRFQSGGWTIHWHGATNDEEFAYGHTVLDAAKNNPLWDVTSSCGVDIWGHSCDDEHSPILEEKRSEADYIVICIGEENYSEKDGDIHEAFLPLGQRDLVKEIKEESNNAKIIVLYFGGRPRLLGEIVDHADAIVLAFLPGPDAGKAIIDLIAGDENFSAKLPITYPKNPDMSGVPYWHAVTDSCNAYASKCPVEWKFGHGLSYTQFEFSKFEWDSRMLYSLPWQNKSSEYNARFSVKVKNTGDRTGIETIMFFIFVEARHVTPEAKRLVSFERVELNPGEERIVEFLLSPEQLRYVGPHDETHDILQMDERFRIGIGPDADCRLSWGMCSDFVTLSMSEEEDYDPACERACTLLHEQSCLSEHKVSPQKCYEKCLSSPSDINVDKSGWGWNYVNCIESILLDRRRPSDSKCHAVDLICRNVFVAPIDTVAEQMPLLATPLKQSVNFVDEITATLLAVCLVGSGMVYFVGSKMMNIVHSYHRPDENVRGDIQSENSPLIGVIL